MTDIYKTYQKLLEDNSFLRQRIKELELSDSEHKLAEEESRRLAAVVRHSRELINLATPEGTMVFLNDAGKKMLGISEEDVAQTNIMEVIPEHLQDKVRREVVLSIERDGYWEGDLQYLNIKNGGLTDVHAITFKIADPVTGTMQFLANISLDITERKLAEDELRRSEAKFRTLYDSTSDAVMLLNEKCFFDCNKATLSIFGCATMEEFCSKHPADLSPTEQPCGTDSMTLSNEHIATVMEKGSTHFEWMHKRKDTGEVFSADVHLTAIELNGKPAVQAVIRDITKRKQVEDALKESKLYYENLINSTNDPLHVVDDKLTIVFANNKFKRWSYAIGIQNDIVGKRVNEVFTFLTEKVCEEYRKVFSTGQSLITSEISEVGGVKYYTETTKAPVLRPDGTVTHVITVVRDITERKRAEEKRRQADRRLTDIIEFLPDATLVIDKDGKVIAWNKAIEEITGICKADMLGKGDYEYALPFYGERRPLLVDLVLKPREEIETSYIIMNRGDDMILSAEAYMTFLRGGGKYLAGKACVLRDTMGNIVGAIESIRDITDRKHLESQFRHAQKMEAIGTLAGGIAHDFNNILSAIMGYTDMAIRMADDNDRLQYYLKQVFKASERAKDLVKQILAFSRQREEKLRPLRVSPIIKEVLKLLRASLPSTIEIRQNIRSDPDTVLADPTHIHQILMNLCTNAAHAMRERAGVLNISCNSVDVGLGDILTTRDLDPGMYLKLTVSDTGVGIDAVTMERIFDPFFTTKRPGEGTGLGLSVVHGIVKSYGGTITVKSEVGRGSEFSVYLPLLMETEERQVITPGEPIPAGMERILLVDDEEMIVEIGESMLTGLGYDVVGLTSSLEALELFRAQPERFDLVITDITMPNMTGIELTRELLRIRPDISVIGCTGFSEMISSESATSIGLKDLIMKPVIKRQLAEAIRRTLGKRIAGAHGKSLNHRR